MADNKYTVTPTPVDGISQYEKYSAEDRNLIESFEINSAFNTTKNIAELHVYSSGNTLLRSVTNYDRYSIGLNSGASKEGSTSISVDPQKDAIFYGYENGGVKLLYLFLNNLFSELKQGLKLYIVEISNDRTELKLNSTGISNEELKSYSLAIKDKIEDTSFFSEFRLNFGNNDLFIGVNIDYNDDEDVVTVKLYESLPTSFTVKSTLDIVEFVANPLAYEVDAEFIPDAPRVPRLREANFNIDLEDNTSTPSQFFNYDELFSFSIDNSNYQVLSLFNEKGAEISIDHTDYSDFIHFSSAEERLINFKYKLDLVKNYEASIANISTVGGSSGITSNKSYYENLIKGVVDNFDHYERYLYFESGSYAWPKSNENKPYINQGSSTSEAITWFTNQRTTANNYDVSNFNALTNTIPAFIREDDNNAQYVLFVQMLAQHFDNLYIYAKAVSDKYDADNRINVGVSRDLVEDAIKSLGVKLYNSSKSLEDLFRYFVGEFQSDTGEVINTDVQAGQLVSGETTVEGTNEGFLVTHTNAIRFTNYPGFNPAFSAALILFSLSNSYTGNFSYGFDNSYFSYNVGGDVFVTITDGEGNSTGPFKYTISNVGNMFSLQQGLINLPDPNIMYIHPIDAEGNDHSTLFDTLNFTQGTNNEIDILIEDKKITQGNPVTEPYQPTSEDIYQKSIYKRVYHNLPFLLKTKGTQRGLRALINCFGIPSSILKIKTYGGRDTTERPFFGDGQSHTVSGQKVRTDNTGSIVEGDTLSRFTSTVKPDDSYNHDLHNVEVGFSPSDNLDTLIQSTLGSDFTIDDYIGDPRDLTLDSYTDLLGVVKTALADVTERYDIKDFVRLIKFFDNVIFKMIKDFVPARSTTDTGIIIKPHLLDKSKAKSVIASATQPEYSGSVDTAFFTGSNAGAYTSVASGSLRFDNDAAKIRAKILLGTPGESSTRRVGEYVLRNVTPTNPAKVKRWKGFTDHGQDEAKFDGELAYSSIVVSTGELNDENTLKQIKYPPINYDVLIFKNPPVDICFLTDNSDVIIIGGFTGEQDYQINIYPDLFELVGGATLFYGPQGPGFDAETLAFDGQNQPINLSSATQVQGNTLTVLADGTNFQQYASYILTAYNSELQGGTNLDLTPSCASRREFKVVRCRLKTSDNSNISFSTHVGQQVDLLQFFEGTDVNTDFRIEVNGNVVENPQAYIVQPDDETVTIIDNQDSTCNVSKTVISNQCGVQVVENPTHTNLEFNVPTFFSGWAFDPQEEIILYYLKILTANDEEFDPQDINYHLEFGPYGYSIANDQSQQEDTWISIPESSIANFNRVVQVSATVTDLMFELFGTTDFFQSSQGANNLRDMKRVQFKAIQHYQDGFCEAFTSTISLLEIRQVQEETVKMITLLAGSTCVACGFDPIQAVEAYYKSVETFSLYGIVSNNLKLFNSEEGAENQDLQDQVDNVHYGNENSPTARSDQEDFAVTGEPIIYKYNAVRDSYETPWGDSGTNRIVCTEGQDGIEGECRGDDRRDDRDTRNTSDIR